MYENYSANDNLEVQQGLNSYISKIYGKMFVGLLVTAITAWLVATNQTVFNIFFGSPLYFVAMIAELVLVFTLSARLAKLSYTTANVMYYVYAVLNGVSLASIFIIYNLPLVYTAFLTTAATFGVMAIYGMVTKKDLTKVGNILTMLLIGIIIASLVNIFLRNSTFDLLISFGGVAIFAGLVAFDTQRLKSYYFASLSDVQMQRKIGIIGALSLYLDFINIFLYILRIFGNKRD